MNLNDTNIPIIGEAKPEAVELEVPALFTVQLWFINHQQQYTYVDYRLPPGLYPNPAWIEHVVETTYRNSLKALKLSTKDLSWRKCTPEEFVKATSGGVQVDVAKKWSKPFTVAMEIDVPEVSNDGNLQ